jgi:hypothetical protein
VKMYSYLISPCGVITKNEEEASKLFDTSLDQEEVFFLMMQWYHYVFQI